MKAKQTREVIIIGLLIFNLNVLSQLGMDYAGPGSGHYSRLRSGFPTLLLQNQNNEKACGIYQNNITPLSFLEVNSTSAYMPFPMLSIPLGEVFRTTSPNNVNSTWRLFTGTGVNAQKFNINVPAASSNVELRAVQNGSMTFLTNSIQRMFIANGGITGGHVGIGSPPFLGAPYQPLGTFQLDVQDNTPGVWTGINFSSNNADRFGYFIDDSLALCVPKNGGNNPNNAHTVTFVGVRAGFNYVSGGNDRWTFVGYNAGANNSGNHNVFMGVSTGANNNGADNVFVGDFAGWQNGNIPNTGNSNTFIGTEAGMKNGGYLNTAIGYYSYLTPFILNGITTGSWNAFCGAASGQYNKGNANVYNGYAAATNNSALTAENNVVVGGYPGTLGLMNNVIIDSNTFVGSGSGANINIALSNAGAFGSNAIARNNHQIIIGNNNVKVGIGLSDDSFGPLNRLEINESLLATPSTPNASTAPASFGASGLRFRKLTAASPTIANPGNGVLGLTANGDVVYVQPAGTASAPANNGLSVNAGTIQLGVACNSSVTPAQIAAAQLLDNRQVPMNNFNFVFSNPTNTWVPTFNSVGVGTSCTPANRLEVDRNTGFNPTSGLRLTQFQLGVVPLPSNNQVLSADVNGDIILTTIPSNTGSAIGNYCSGISNPLTGNFEIPTGGFNYKFTGQNVIAPNAPQQDMVSIGYACSVTPLPVAKFNVLEKQTASPLSYNTYAGYFINANVGAPGSPNSILTGGVYGEAKGGAAPSLTPAINAGGVFEGYGTLANVGVMGRIVKHSFPNIPISTGGYAIGGVFLSDTSVLNTFGIPCTNYGVFARATKGFANYGIYAEAVSTSTNGPNYAGYFNGDVVRMGGSDNFTSDQILKTNINPMPNSLALINQLLPKTFNYNASAFPQMNFPYGLQYGLIAQDVQTVIPALVNTATHPAAEVGGTNYPPQSYLTLEYTQLIPIMIKAIQQLSAKTQSQDSMIQILKNNINDCCENNQARQTNINGNGTDAQTKVLTQLNVDLSDKDVIVLDQNIPNPYAEQCTITYNVPEQYKFAQIIFKTVDGKIIKAVDIVKKGRGQLNVFAADLSNGLYMYTLIVDGKIIDSKKMVKQN